MSCSNPSNDSSADPATSLMPRKRPVRRVDKGVCQRCRQSKSAYIIRTVTYCRACFQANVHFRFLRQLFPPLRPPSELSRSVQLSLGRPAKLSGHALIALSGGAGSMAMLEMLLERDYVGTGSTTEVDRRKGEKDPIWEKGTVVYVDFSGVASTDAAVDRTDDLRRMAQSRGLDFIGLRAEDVFDPELGERLGRMSESLHLSLDLTRPDLPIAPSTSTRTPLEALRNLLASLPSASRPSLLSAILDHLLTLVAYSLPQVTHILLGETSSRQAERVISGTALGRGWSLPLELASAFTLPPPLGNEKGERAIMRLKPMKDITLKEAAIFCRVKGVETLNQRGWGSGEGSDARGKSGIATLEMLTEQFVAGLSVTHPSTVSTINRTGDKLVFAGKAEDNTLCPACQLPVDQSALEWKSRTGLTRLPGKTPPAIQVADELPDSAVALAPLLCYGCLTTFTPSRSSRTRTDGPVDLPCYIGISASKRHGSGRAVSRQRMKDEIGAFLLDQDSTIDGS